jgi:NAD(P)H-dependent FMN reductase
MITIINATNRIDNRTQVVSQFYYNFLISKGIEARLWSLNHLPISIVNQDYGTPGPELMALASEFIVPADKLVFVTPEYNGSIPGILKLFIDSLKPAYFKNKRAALVGVASGRAGNLRGLDHLTSILHHLGVEVLSKRAYVSHLEKVIADGKLEDAEARQNLENQALRLLEF